eukprot:UN24516
MRQPYGCFQHGNKVPQNFLGSFEVKFHLKTPTLARNLDLNFLYKLFSFKKFFLFLSVRR